MQSSFIDGTLGVDLGDMQLISNFNKRFRFLLCVNDIFSKFTWVTNAFQKILKESDWKPNKLWVDKSSEFSNRSMRSWLEKIT